MIKKKTEEQNILHNKVNVNNFYYSFNARLIVNFIVFILLLVIGVFFLIESFVFENAKIVNYSEYSNLDYKVYLKENSFYDNEYLPKDMLYVASLIDKIKIYFNYDFVIEEVINLNFEYEIFAKLIISDENEYNVYYEKVYNLLDKKSVLLENDTNIKINEIIELDYDMYNKIANNFKASYGLNTKNKLVVYFNVNKDTNNSNDENLLVNNKINSMVINIPLSERSVDIGLNYKDINNESNVLNEDRVVIDNIICLLISVLSIITSLVFMIKLMRLLRYVIRRKDVYNNYISKILNEYDRLIVETTTPPILNENDKEKIIRIEKFTELLDVRDNLKQPIMYYIVVKNQKCYFYINGNDKIYLTVIKRIDLEVYNEKN